MKFILKNNSGVNKKFSSEEKLRDFLTKNNWPESHTQSILRYENLLGWSLEIIPENNKERFNLLWEEVEEAFCNSDYDGDLDYYVKKEYRFLAVDSWQNTGASKYKFSAKIPKYRINEDNKHFWDSVDYFQCPDCYHTGFYDYDENIEYLYQCLGCSRKIKIPSYRNVLKIKNLLKDIAS
jgi:hypothetical protein